MTGARPALAAALALLATSAAAQSRPPIPCGAVYVIQRGDTLHRVAVRAYGPEATYRDLWDVNREQLGTRNPSLIEIGTEIFVPCLDADGAPILDGAPWMEAEAPGGAAADADAGSDLAAAPPPAIGETDMLETRAGPGPDATAAAAPDDVTASAPVAAPDADAPSADGAMNAAAVERPAAAPAPALEGVATADAPPADAAMNAAAVEPPTVAPAPGSEGVATADAPPAGDGAADMQAVAMAPPAEEPAAAGAAPADPSPAADVAPPANNPEPAPVAAPPAVVVVGDNALAASVARAALADSLGDAAPAVTPAGPEGAPAVLLALAPPACATAGGCDDTLWSSSLIDDALVFHARPGADAAAALRGGAVCASGAEVAQAARAAAGPRATVTTAPDAAACLAAVAGGAADVAVSTATAADAAGHRPGVEEALALTRPVSLRATAPRDDPQAAAILRALDEGLAALRASGGWFDTVQRHFDKAL